MSESNHISHINDSALDLRRAFDISFYPAVENSSTKGIGLKRVNGFGAISYMGMQGYCNGFQRVH